MIRAAAATVDGPDIVVIASQAIHDTVLRAPADLTESMEADAFPKDNPQLSIVIDGAIGERSMFHDTSGDYAHGVDETTAVLPSGWEDRLVRLESPATVGAVGWCLDLHDRAVSKLAAGRPKDRAYVSARSDRRLVEVGLLRDRVGVAATMHPTVVAAAIAFIDRLGPAAG